ncbi:terminase small subunit [Anaerotignum sp.]|uniref:terminase small subunit n=1 Tax=Anaerotignum sp. TaxID=2039241 RepID=UPI00289E49D1|nr:terminase small subunit [Anaerotignum sp.]
MRFTRFNRVLESVKKNGLDLMLLRVAVCSFGTFMFFLMCISLNSDFVKNWGFPTLNILVNFYFKFRDSRLHKKFSCVKKRARCCGMTKKQKMFVEEYLIDLNATQAAIRAGYSPQTAYSIGQENLNKPEIKNALEKAMAERSRRTGISADRVLMELAKMAFVNPKDVINMSDGSVRKDASDDDLACVQSVKVKTSYFDTGETIEKETKLYDKKASLELLGKHLGIFTDKVKVEGSTVVQILDNIPEGDSDDKT